LGKGQKYGRFFGLKHKQGKIKSELKGLYEKA